MAYGLNGGGRVMKQSARSWRARVAICVSALLLFGCGKSNSHGDDDDADDDGSAGEVGAGAAPSGGSAGRGGSGAAGGSGGSGGSSGSVAGGSAGSAGTVAVPSDGFATTIRPTTNAKVDLLLMVDNSLSMGEKQRLLADSVPRLLSGLETASLDDVHVGIITSSLGHHGSNDVCSDVASNPAYNDRAQLLPSVRPDLSSWNESGFLAWDPGGKLTPPGTGSGPEFAAQLMDQVAAAGELGCGYESSLEAWYRFLIDPDPAANLDNDSRVTVRNGTNNAVLEQRQRFLRTDSQLAIVVLTDENDCSIVDENGAQGWLVGFKGGPTLSSWRMPYATASCANPNSPCCRPCILEPASGCPSSDADGCPTNGNRSSLDDSMNLRCFQQTQRFGLDLLYPVQRYVDALASSSIDPRMDGNRVANPLFSSNGSTPVRTHDMVVLLGIVGVPWQDIATADSLSDPRGLRFLSAAELTREGRWEVALGDPANAVPPQDPLMIESIEPRPTGSAHPLVAGAEVVGPGTNTRSNPINGHEFDTSARREDLQYACIFPLAEPVPCSAANTAGCACNQDESATNSPLCRFDEPASDGVQEYTKAYPSIRPLQVLRALGDRSLVASICPKNVQPAAGMTPAEDPDYGYNPAVSALLDRLAASSAPSCLNRALSYDSTSDGDRIACSVVETGFDLDGSCRCNEAEGRQLLDEDSPTRGIVRQNLEANGLCGGGTGVVCDVACACEVRQLAGTELTACQNELDEPAGVYGFCYVDGASGNANSDLVQHCQGGATQRIRVLGTPQNDGASTFLVCPGG